MKENILSANEKMMVRRDLDRLVQLKQEANEQDLIETNRIESQIALLKEALIISTILSESTPIRLHCPINRSFT